MEWALKIGVKGDKKRTSQYCCCAEAIYGPDLARTPRGPTIPIVCGWGSCWEIYMECKGAAIALPLAATTSIVYQQTIRGLSPGRHGRTRHACTTAIQIDPTAPTPHWPEVTRPLSRRCCGIFSGPTPCLRLWLLVASCAARDGS